MKSTSTPTVGVIIARFQVPALHRAHHELVGAVQARHKKVVILLGCAPVRVTRRNPLDFFSRERMLKKKYPDIVVQAVSDHPSDEEWSREVDRTIARVTGGETALLYGSRDSFIPHYSGRHPMQELDASHMVSGTQLRKDASDAVRSDPGFRMGVVYATFQRYPTLYQTVDVLVWRRERTPHDGDGPATGDLWLLLAKKDIDSGKYRFVGGFVDPADASLEAAAKREAFEETGLAVQDPHYLFSARVDDWRYRSEADGICTAVFACEYFFGGARAGDDVDGLVWCEVDTLSSAMLVPEHQDLWPQARALLERLVEA